MNNPVLRQSCMLLALLTVVSISSGWAAEKPLLLDGKDRLYQRVLSKTDAKLYSNPASDSSAAAITPFSVFYVYARKTTGKQQWLNVGPDIHGTLTGWIPEGEALPWNQGLTVAFRNPVDGERALLFKDRDSLKEIVEAPKASEYSKLYAAAANGKLPADSSVVAIQPNFHVDLASDFYLAPILDHEDVFYGDGQAKMLQIATATQVKPQAKADVEEIKLVVDVVVPEDFTSGVVFVVDTTLSMGPYIERTRDAISKIFKRLTQSDALGKVKFGLVGYRDASAGDMNLVYLSNTFANLQQGANEKQFFDSVNGVEASRVSSRDFREDAYAGVKTALDEIDWQSVDARYIVLITDAGPRTASDELSSTGLDHKALQQLAGKKNIALSVVHLLTDMGVNDHASAKSAYEKLTEYPGIGSLYFGVPHGNLTAFGQAVDALTGQIAAEVQMVATGKVATEQPVTAQAEADKPNQVAEIEAKFNRLGNALRMQYLAEHEDGSIPEVFNAWILDRSLTDPKKRMLDVGVVLTRDQLGEMHGALAKALDTFENGLIEPRSFLEDIKTLAVTISNDPEALKRPGGIDLASMGWMHEYIENLPYQSESLKISLDDWESWSISKQLEFIQKLQEKIAYYQAVYDHTDMWYSPAGGPINGDSIIALSLDMLP